MPLEEEIWGALVKVGVSCEGALHLWGAQGVADPSVGAGGGTWSTSRCLTVTLLAMSSCGLPGPVQRPTSLKFWSYHLSKFHMYVLVYCNGLYLSGLLHSV